MNDSAEFSCLAENTFGRANTTIALIVQVTSDINGGVETTDRSAAAGNGQTDRPTDRPLLPTIPNIDVKVLVGCGSCG